ncbi:MAG: bifunctional phosphoribosyl-AMP cyclohydrolase/phosphoribosyl-ATP diphosphatase HisIE [Ginsengibacter sp.]
MNTESVDEVFLKSIDFSKYVGAIVPAIIQDNNTGIVLMLGYMNEIALRQTLETKLVTFYSRSKQRLWVKGETSKNYLHFQSVKADCDKDAILIKAIPAGPVCHTGSDTCFDEDNKGRGLEFLSILQSIISERKNNPSSESYTSSLFKKGMNAIAQKVGEEAVELVIESKDSNESLFLNEAADLLFHYLILLEAKDQRLENVIAILKDRHNKK